jgi:hypothetical protein
VQYSGRRAGRLQKGKTIVSRHGLVELHCNIVGRILFFLEEILFDFRPRRARLRQSKIVSVTIITVTTSMFHVEIVGRCSPGINRDLGVMLVWRVRPMQVTGATEHGTQYT